VAVEYDEIGIWSEVKLAIVREYAAAYSKIMEAWRRDKINRLSWIYIDGYAGPGYHVSKATGEVVEGRRWLRRRPTLSTLFGASVPVGEGHDG